MAVVDDIEALAARAVTDLGDLHDFGAHLHVMWTRFRLWVQAGNTLQSRSKKTASVVSERDLIKRYARYRTKYVQALSFIQLSTVFEAFLFDFLRLLLTNEVNAVITGAQKGGADEFVVNDAHSVMRNLHPQDLAGRATLITGW